MSWYLIYLKRAWKYDEKYDDDPELESNGEKEDDNYSAIFLFYKEHGNKATMDMKNLSMY